MARPRKPIDLFDLGFPIHSRAGLKQVDRQLEVHAKMLGDQMGRAGYYGETELNELAEPLIRQWATFMNPGEEEINRINGLLNVQHQGAAGYADSQLMLANQRIGKMTKGQVQVKPGTFYGFAPSGPGQWPGGAQRPAPGQVGAPTLSADPHNFFGLPNWDSVRGCITGKPPPGYSYIGGFSEPWSQANQAYWYTGADGTQVPVPFCSPSQPTPRGAPGEIAKGIPSAPSGTHTCPECGCVMQCDNQPGSSCDRPLYVVQCVPKPKVKTCPAPTNSNSSSRSIQAQTASK